MKLNIGCGKDIEDGWININRISSPGVDTVMNFSTEPLPYQNDSVDHILVAHVLEYIMEWENRLEECHRVLRSGGTIKIRVSYEINYAAFHKRFFDESTLDQFILGSSDNGRSNEYQPLFRLKDLRWFPRMPFRWHLKRYLHIPTPKSEIVWKLEAIK